MTRTDLVFLALGFLIAAAWELVRHRYPKP